MRKVEIKVAKHSGFCFGVREALRKTEETIEKYKGTGRSIYTCGPLIHNSHVISELEEKGVFRIGSLDEAEPGSVVVVRSHGEGSSFYRLAEKRGILLVDATCPFVLRIHRLAEEARKQGRNVVIVGNREHPEVQGTAGWTDHTAEIVSNGEEAALVEGERVTVVAQTTITERLWNETTEELKKRIPDLILHPTICSATRDRQDGCRNVAAVSDFMVVIGDRESSNSQKLYEIAKENCAKAIFVERKEDLPLKEVERCNKIGVAAGASTPERIIKEVISTMSEFVTENNPVEEVVSEAAAAAETAHEEPCQMGDLMDEIEKSLRLPGRGEIVEGEIVQVTNKYIVVNLGCKKDGIIPKDELTVEGEQELTDLYKEGDTIQAKVIKNDDGDGNILLSKKKLEVNEHWDEINEALENKTVVNAKVVKEVRGGVIAVYKEVAGFIPMSQLSDKFVEKADEFVGKVLPVKVSRVDQKRNKAVFSHKAYLAEEKQKRIQEIWDSINVGDVVEGTVMRFTDYGAFVDIGGLDGLLHISEISWGKLKHPQEALEIGQKINVKILSMNNEKGKISLGLKQNQPEPWSVIDEKYAVGQVIEGKVVQIKEYGAFVELEPGLDGLVHISEIAFKRVTNIADELTVGQVVQAKILEIDKERKRISLSIKATLDEPAQEEVPAEETAEEA